MKLGMLLLEDKGGIKNVMKRVGHHACFHATMLTNMAIKVTWATNKGDYFPVRRVILVTELDILWLFIHLRPRKRVFKYPALLYPFNES